MTFYATLLIQKIFTNTNPDPFNNGQDFFTKLTAGITRIFSILFSILDTIMNAIQMLYQSICDIVAWVDNMISAIQNNDFDNFPLIQAIGCYRYLVGDLVFYLTYVTIVSGCLFTIYKLVTLIYSRITGYTGNGLMTGLLSKLH